MESSRKINSEEHNFLEYSTGENPVEVFFESYTEDCKEIHILPGT
jgi:hypothetical protein